MRQAFRGPIGPLPFNIRQPVVLEDIVEQPAVGEMLRRLFRGHWETAAPMLQGIHTVVFLPLLYRGEVLGVLSFHHDAVRPYAADDLRLAEAI
ncbi:GAF domain-containing protein, partial [Klebsiella pneumoniae]|uniref:GAF domain-containing protein n=1 Tax=Klebsiella pneumoniae TaxID=573 RepID=UPI00226E218F